MMKRISLAVAAAVVMTSMSSVAAQMWETKAEQLGKTPGGSPKVRTEWVTDTATMSLTYSRPSLNGRTLDAIIKPDMPWPAGDGEPAVLTSNKAMVFDKVTVPAGTYSLWVITKGDSWTLAINKATTGAYQQAQDVARVEMQVQKLENPIDQHTLQIAVNSDYVNWGNEVRLLFGNVRAFAHFLIKRT